MTPIEIEIALWYYCRASGDYGRFNGDNNFDAPAVQSALKGFIKRGFLAANPPPSDAIYSATPALKVYVDALCNVPLPIQQWVIPRQ